MIDVSSFSYLPIPSLSSKLPSGNYAGYCMLDASGFMYSFGGKSGAAAGGVAAQICNPSVNSCGSTLIPELVSGAWNSEGTSMSIGRQYLACSQEAPFVFVTGGDTGGSVLTRSVDRTIQ